METNNNNNEQSLKICKVCELALVESAFRPHSKACRKCISKQDAINHKNKLKEYYINNKERLDASRMALYWKTREGVEPKIRRGPKKEAGDLLVCV